MRLHLRLILVLLSLTGLAALAGCGGGETASPTAAVVTTVAATETRAETEGEGEEDEGSTTTGADTETGETETVETEPGETGGGETETGGTDTGGGETETDGETQGDTGDGGAVPASNGDPAAGEPLWGANGCGACHTLEAAGSNGMVGPNLDESKPDYALAVNRVTNGKGAMPSFKASLSAKQIADVAAYVVASTK